MSVWRQRYAEWLLALILGLCSLWQVEEVLVRFIEGSTTTTLEKEHNEHLPLPKVALCMKQRYNYGALGTILNYVCKKFCSLVYPLVHKSY